MEVHSKSICSTVRKNLSYERKRRISKELDPIFFEWCKGESTASIAKRLQLPDELVSKRVYRLNHLF